jgi:hypothetical protein
MTFLLSSSNPSNGAVDFQINKTVELSFNKDVLTSSLRDNSISIINTATGRVIPTKVERTSLDHKKVIVTPLEYLTELTLYKVQIIGSDLSFGYYLEAEDGEYLVDTVYVSFTTGTGVYKIDETLQKQSQDLTLEGDLFLPSNVKALGYDFTISLVRPKNHSINVNPDITGDNTIRFRFSDTLYTGDASYSDWIDVNVSPILDTTAYLASGTTLGSDSITIPGYSVSLSGSDLLVQFDNELPKNALVTASLSNSIVSQSGVYYGGEMEYAFHTKLYPDIKAVETIKREVRFVALEFYDDFINSLLFKNFIFLWEKTGRSLTVSSLPFSVIQYCIYSTALDLIEDKDLEKYILGGTRKKIADIDVSYTSLLGNMALKAKKLEQLKDAALESLFKGRALRTGVLNVFLEAADSVNRLWYDISSRYTLSSYKYYQANEPSSNVQINRQAKTNNPWY